MPSKSRRAHRLKVVNPDCAGIDIGKDRHFVAVDPARTSEPVREFGAFTRYLEAGKRGCPRQPSLEVIREPDRLIAHFVAGTTTRTAARLCGLNRKTETFYFHRLREIISLGWSFLPCMSSDRAGLPFGRFRLHGRFHSKLLPTSRDRRVAPSFSMRMRWQICCWRSRRQAAARQGRIPGWTGRPVVARSRVRGQGDPSAAAARRALWSR